MNKQDVIEFFNRCADGWDLTNHKDPVVMAKLLDFAGIKQGVSVLDVGCGTGVMFPFYQERGVSLLTAVDISPGMVRVAREKYPHHNIVCADVETLTFAQKFDAAVVFNAFPHFGNPENLIKVLSGFLKPGGRLTVCHDMSRAELDRLHAHNAGKVSMGLMHEDELEKLFNLYLKCDIKISDDEKYVVSGINI